MSATRRPGLRVALPLLLSVVLVVPLTVLWLGSRVPSSFSVMSMGYADYGGGSAPETAHAHGSMPGMPPTTGTSTIATGAGPSPGRLVTQLVADPARAADVDVELVARRQRVTVGGVTIDGYTLNGQTPGPQLTAIEGQLVQVRLRNESVAGGTTLHWHGVDVPNAMDGVAGVTQDAVPVGGSFLYRFVAEHAGTYWYHSHQVADPQVAGGLFGALVVLPRGGAKQQSPTDVTAVAHTYAGVRTLNGTTGDARVAAAPGASVTVRVVNTDNGPVHAWATTAYRVTSVDGTQVNAPGEVVDRALTVTAGGRADLQVTAPLDGTSVRVQVSRATAVVVGGSKPDAPAAPEPTSELDLLGYGAPAPLAFDPGKADRRFTYSIGRRPGFVRGKPGLWWSINGNLYPNVPMFVVREGDVVTMHIDNSSGDVHPMHLHGHHAVVLRRNGTAATGSPWWVDSLNVRDGESYDIAFVADNPGVWMDHCHNLAHAADGMVAHLMYEGVDTPFRVSADGNVPE